MAFAELPPIGSIPQRLQCTDADLPAFGPKRYFVIIVANLRVETVLLVKLHKGNSLDVYHCGRAQFAVTIIAPVVGR